MEIINIEYFNDKPHSYGGKYRLYEILQKGYVDKALKNNDIYTKFKQHKKSKKCSPIYVYRKRELFQSLMNETIDKNANPHSTLLRKLMKQYLLGCTSLQNFDPIRYHYHKDK